MADELTNETQGQTPAPENAGTAESDSPAPTVPETGHSADVPQTANSLTTDASQTSAPQADPGRADARRTGVPAGQRGRGSGSRGGGKPGGRPGGRRQGRPGRPGQAEAPSDGIDETVVKVYRCATVVKGGRRFSFSAMAVVGDRNGRVGVGYGKANEVPSAVEKATKVARRALVHVKLEGTTIPHRVMSKYGASKVLLLPAGEGTGVIAGTAVRAVLELAGVKDVLTKSYGSNSPKSLVKATFEGLRSLRSKEDVEKLREVTLRK